MTIECTKKRVIIEIEEDMVEIIREDVYADNIYPKEDTFDEKGNKAFYKWLEKYINRNPKAFAIEWDCGYIEK